MDIYFNKTLHKYTDINGNTFKAVSNLIGQFKNDFDYEFWATAKGIERLIIEKQGNDVWIDLLNKYKSKYKKDGWKKLVEKFKSKNNKKLIEDYSNIVKHEWSLKNKKAIDTGNFKHDLLEDIINKSLQNDIDDSKDLDIFRVVTVKDLEQNYRGLHNSLMYLDKLKDLYPKIHNVFVDYISKGYIIFAEIVTYSLKHKVCGTIDVPIINFTDKSFYIEDWKTNEKELKFESGYYKKDFNGDLTKEWIATHDKLKYPLQHLDQCSGIEYTIQLSLYANLVERLTGFACKGLIINHIRDDSYKRIPVPYLKKETTAMLEYKEDGTANFII